MAAGSYQLIWVAGGGNSGTVTLASLPQTGATPGQAIVWNGSVWAPATVGGGTGTLNSLSGQVSTGTVDSNGNAVATVNSYTGTVALSQLAQTSAANGQVVTWTGSAWAPATPASGGGGSGTVTSVGLSDTSTTPIYTVSGSPVTGSGTLSLALNSQSTASIFAVSTTGGGQPTFQSMALGHLPSATAQTVLRSPGSYGVASGSPVWGNVYAPDMRTPTATSGQVLTATGTVTAPTWQTPTPSTSANTPSTIVARDSSGNFSAGTITAALNGNATTATTASSASAYTGTVALSQLAQTSATTGQTVTWNGTAWAPATPASGAAGITGLTGDVTTAAGSSGSTAATVAQVGGQSNTAVALAATSVASASSSATASVLAQRDGTGALFASTGTSQLVGGSYTATASVSGVTYIANNGTNTVTLPVNAGSASNKFRFLGQGATITINPPTTGTTPTFYYFGGSTTNAVNQVNLNTAMYIECTGIPGTSNYFLTNIQGNWQSGGTPLGVYSSLSYPSTNGYVLTANGNTGLATFAPVTSGGMASATVVAKLANATYTSADRGAIWHNFGATAAYTYTLAPAPTIGDTYWAMAYSGSANALKVQQGNANHLIYFPTFTTTAGTTHGITISTGGRSGTGVIALCYIATNTWVWTGGYPFDWGAY